MRGLTIVKTRPQPIKAIETAEMALELIKAAEEKIKNQNTEETYTTSLQAIRMAAASLMFMDGYIAPTLEGAVEYIKNNHPRLNAEEWKIYEYNHPKNRSIVDAILEMLNIKKKINEEEMLDKVFSLAKEFVNYAERATKYGKIE
ncbi:MAG: hypothetical protein QW153_03240 [Candidatus Bilamarchaeaceae archaeon]